ncbi:hypothetical protein ACFWUQ_28275, partial [Streptomyces sp. NPDC058662]|uniref:hypothetical protein n=1 Tax=Streptomyces sp. NPDC058662 TaxID=3346583 RepID=UPI00365F74D7
MTDNPAPMRAARAATFAAMCVALGAAGHSYMSGTDIPLLGLLGAFGLTGSLAWLAAGRRCGPVGITATLLAVQGVLHLVFSGSQAAGPSSGAAPAHHHHATAAAAAAVGEMAGMGEPAAAVGHGGAAMIAAHVLAGLFCAVWLARGEAAVFRLVRALRSAAVHAAGPLSRAFLLLRARTAPEPAPPAAPSRRPRRARPRRLRGAVHAHAVVR